MAVAVRARASTQVAVYVRISDDPELKRLGVRRQEDDCRNLAKRLGISALQVYEDNDLSAFKESNRPSYERMLADIEAGLVTRVITWHHDRLYRHPKDLERLVAVCDEHNVSVETVRAGLIDMSNPSGRMVARILGAVSRQEVEHKADRVRAKHLQLATDGLDAGGFRSFGYADDRVTVQANEAALIKEAAARVLRGASVRSVCKDWNTRGIRTSKGGLWTPSNLKRVLVSARISGRREIRHLDSGKRVMIGRIVAKHKQNAPIITVDESDRLRAQLGDPARRKNHTLGRTLLSGIAVCGLCGAPMMAAGVVGKQRRIACRTGLGFRGCGKILIAALPLEDLVTEAVLRRVDGGALLKVMRRAGGDRAAIDELVKVESKLDELAHDWAADLITRGEWDSARRTLIARRDDLQKRVERAQRALNLDGLPNPLRSAWPKLEMHRRRAVIGALVEAVVIGPGIKGLNRFDDRRVSIRWKA